MSWFAIRYGGSADGASSRDALIEQMSGEQLAEAKARAADYLERYGR